MGFSQKDQTKHNRYSFSFGNAVGKKGDGWVGSFTIPWSPIVTGLISDILGNSAVGEI